MLELLLSHFAVDGCGVPDSVNRFLTIPLLNGGRAPSGCGRDRAGGCTSIALCALHGAGAPARPGPWREGADTNPKRQSMPGKLLPVSICNSEKSPSIPKVAASLHVSFTDGAFSSRI